MCDCEEVWVGITGYEGLYQISSKGRVRSLDHDTTHRNHPMRKKGRVLQIRRDGKGYHQYRLYRNGESNYPKVHRMVATHFTHNPDNLPQINHIDEDKENNCVCNLEWCTNLYNARYSFAKSYIFTSPLGCRMEIHNLSQFCKENGLVSSLMHKVYKGKRVHHKGWKIWEES